MRDATADLERALDRLGAVAHALTDRPLPIDTRIRFSRYAGLIQLWNRTHNLTALRSPAEIVRGLFEDSLLFLQLVPRGATLMIDIGAGAGIPGLPLHLVAPALAVVLVEARQKRVSFLKTVKRELALDDRVTVVEGRAEAVLLAEPKLRATADVVVARGVGHAATLIKVTEQYLKPGGVFIASGPPVSEIPAPDRAGWTIVALPEFRLTRAFMVRTA